jgi:hypothetical protein
MPNALIASQLTEQLESPELEHDLDQLFHDRVVVSLDDTEVFCYAGTQAQAEGAERTIQSLAGTHGWEAEFELRHWHPEAEEWVEPDVALPDTPEARAAEHEELVARERSESLNQGYPDFEVRIQCRHHRDAVRLSKALAGEGLQNVRRSKYVVIGALDEDSANALAERLRAESPSGSTVTVEASVQAALEDQPVSPFAVFGGLGG